MNKTLKKTDLIVYFLFGIMLVAALFGIFREYKSSKSYVFDFSAFPGPVDSTTFSLPKGSFSIDFSYQAANDLSISLKADNDMVVDIALPSSENHVSFPFVLEHPTDRAKFRIETDDPSSVAFQEIRLHADRFLYTDFIFHFALLIIVIAGIALIFKKRPSIDMKNLLFLTAVCIVINLPLYIYQGSNWGVDTRVHMLRTEGVMMGLLDRQLPVIISPNFLNEFGELSFLYPDIFLYPFGILRVLGVSMFTVYRFLMVTINIATVLSIYYSAKLICKKNLIVYAAVILYTFEAHRLRIMFMNGAGGGAGIAQIFIPLCIVGFYLIIRDSAGSNDKNPDCLKGAFLLSFGITGVMQSHIMSLFLLGVFLIVMFLPFIRTLFADKCKKLLFLFLSALLVLIMNLGFLVIFVTYYFSDWSSAALFWSDYISWCLTPKDILTSPQSHFYIVMLLISAVLLFLLKKKMPDMQKTSTEYRLALAMTIFTGALYFMSTSLFPWKPLMDSSKIIYNLAMFIQQPHRFFSLIEAPAVLSPILLLSIVKKNLFEAVKIRKIRIISLSVLAVMLTTGIFSEMKMFFSNDPLLFDRVTGDYNTELLLDYVPEGTSEESIGPDAGKLSDDSKVESLSYSKRGTHIDYTYICHADGIYADLPLLYYKGYRASDENNAASPIRKGEDGHILADLNGDGLQHSLHVRFKVSRIFTILWLFSIGSFFVILCVFLKKNLRH